MYASDVSFILHLLFDYFSPVVLCASGETYTWGSNSHGQLGVGDLLSRGSPTTTRLPPNVRVVQVAAGSNHTVFLTANGQIYTCGDFQVCGESCMFVFTYVFIMESIWDVNNRNISINAFCHNVGLEIMK